MQLALEARIQSNSVREELATLEGYMLIDEVLQGYAPSSEDRA
jgi:hypothetical protein